VPYSLPINHCIVYFFKKAGVIVDKISANLSVSISLQWGWEKLFALVFFEKRANFLAPVNIHVCDCIWDVSTFPQPAGPLPSIINSGVFQGQLHWPHTHLVFQGQLHWPHTHLHWRISYTDPSVTLYNLLCMFESACNYLLIWSMWFGSSSRYWITPGTRKLWSSLLYLVSKV